MEKQKNAVGRRKEAVTRVFLSKGDGKITINGKPLTPPEALSVRLAVDNWAAELALNPHALGEDEHGHKMRENYLGHLHRVLHAMLEP